MISLIFKHGELQSTKDRRKILPVSRKVASTRRTPPNAGYHFSSSKCRRTWNAKSTFFSRFSFKINLKQPRNSYKIKK